MTLGASVRVIFAGSGDAVLLTAWVRRSTSLSSTAARHDRRCSATRLSTAKGAVGGELTTLVDLGFSPLTFGCRDLLADSAEPKHRFFHLLLELPVRRVSPQPRQCLGGRRTCHFFIPQEPIPSVGVGFVRVRARTPLHVRLRYPRARRKELKVTAMCRCQSH